jgi:hypothetical protein
MPKHARFYKNTLRMLLLLCLGNAHAQTAATRSLAEEMDSTNTATGNMLSMIKTAKAQERAAKAPPAPTQSQQPGGPDGAVKAGAKTGAKKEVNPLPEASPEAPTLWYLAGVGDKLVAELVYQQRLYSLRSDSQGQNIGPWTLLSIDTQGLHLSHKGGQTVNLSKTEPMPAPPALPDTLGWTTPGLSSGSPAGATAGAFSGVPAVTPLAAPSGNPLLNILKSVR